LDLGRLGQVFLDPPEEGFRFLLLEPQEDVGLFALYD
jgi:hypothetical protein